MGSFLFPPLRRVRFLCLRERTIPRLTAQSRMNIIALVLPRYPMRVVVLIEHAPRLDVAVDNLVADMLQAPDQGFDCGHRSFSSFGGKKIIAQPQSKVRNMTIRMYVNSFAFIVSPHSLPRQTRHDPARFFRRRHRDHERQRRVAGENENDGDDGEGDHVSHLALSIASSTHCGSRSSK